MKKAILIMCCLVMVGCSDVRVGDVWRMRSEDPFKRESMAKYEILDVKQGFVKFRNSKTSEVKTERINYFSISLERISRVGEE